MACSFFVRFWSGMFLFVVGSAVGACDSAPGPTSAGFPPELSDFSFGPQEVVLEEQPAERVVDGHVRVPLSLEVTAQDPEGAVAEVGFVVASPLGGVPVAAGTLAPVGAGRYEAVVPVAIPVSDVGPYTVRLYAVDAAGLVGNEVRGILRFTAQGAPPVLEAVEVPANVVRPQEDEPPLAVEVAAVVSDPDGLRNVSRVVFWEAARPEAVFALRDDGQVRQSGDAAAADGRYTALFRVEASTPPGERTFLFQAYDRAGLASAVVEKVFQIE